MDVVGTAAHQPLDRRHDVLRLAGAEQARLLTDQNAARRRIGNDRRHQSLARLVMQSGRLTLAGDGHH